MKPQAKALITETHGPEVTHLGKTNTCDLQCEEKKIKIHLKSDMKPAQPTQ